MLGVIKLLYVESVIFEFNDCPFVVVDIAVIRCTKNGDNDREVTTSIPSVHFISVELSFMSADNRN